MPRNVNSEAKASNPAGSPTAPAAVEPTMAPSATVTAKSNAVICENARGPITLLNAISST